MRYLAYQGEQRILPVMCGRERRLERNIRQRWPVWPKPNQVPPRVGLDQGFPSFLADSTTCRMASTTRSGLSI